MTDCNSKPILKLCGTVHVGVKGQIVIPKEVRETMQIANGDSLTLVLKDNKYLGVVKNENMQDLLNYVEFENTFN